MSKQSMTLILIWVLLFALFLPVLLFITDKMLYLYVFVASLIMIAIAVLVGFIPLLNPDPMERNFVALLIGLIGAIGIFLSWMILKGSLSSEAARYIGLGAGLGASQLTGLVLYHYLQKRKIVQ